MTPAPARTENLPLIFQEVFTAIVRLRSNRQALSDVESFRYQMREALKTAAQEARNRAGYTSDDIRMATLAVVGFLDESILNARNPLFADWPRKPLQEELFGIHMAGEVFFQNLEQLMGRSDSADLADLLEVHYLCLLLGFTGRYSGSRTGELQALMNNIAAKIRRIRGPYGALSPAWAPEGEVVRAASDPWMKWLVIGAAACLLMTVILFVAFKISLGSGANLGMTARLVPMYYYSSVSSRAATSSYRGLAAVGQVVNLRGIGNPARARALQRMRLGAMRDCQSRAGYHPAPQSGIDNPAQVNNLPHIVRIAV